LFQKRRLDIAYKALFEKNIEIIEYQKQSSETYQEKYRKSALTHDMQDELLDVILSIMESPAIFLRAQTYNTKTRLSRG